MTNSRQVGALLALGLAIAAMGFYVANADDAPGAAVIGFLMMAGAVALGVRASRNRLPAWAGPTALAVGLIVAACAAYITHDVAIRAPLFARPSDVTSVSAPASSAQHSAAIARARELARAAVLQQNLPGVSVAVGVGGALVWAEGFGWRDVETQASVTPATRFNIGSAASVVSAAPAASLGLVNTGTDSAAEWSPGHVGEPEEDFPGFAFVHEAVLRPLGVSAAAQPLPGERATFYVPSTFWKDDTTDPRRGRRLMYMRDLACCVNGMAFSSTPSDLVRFAMATNADSLDGELAGGRVMSLVTRRDGGIVVSVASNIAHANTRELALKVMEAFAAP
jgi:hypothetical protein